MRTYTPKYFEAYELVPPEIYQVYGTSSFGYIDCRMSWTADKVREHFGVTTFCNTYKFGGARINSGFRSPSCEVGARLSQHKFGRALDLILKGIDAEEARQEILKKQRLSAFKYITRMEKGVDWLHIDLKDTGLSQIILFNP